MAENDVITMMMTTKRLHEQDDDGVIETTTMMIIILPNDAVEAAMIIEEDEDASMMMILMIDPFVLLPVAIGVAEGMAMIITTIDTGTTKVAVDLLLRDTGEVIVTGEEEITIIITAGPTTTTTCHQPESHRPRHHILPLFEDATILVDPLIGLFRDAIACKKPLLRDNNIVPTTA